MLKKSILAGLTLAIVVAVAMLRLRASHGNGQDCNTSFYLTALSSDGQKSSNLYLRQCGTINRGIAEREYFVVVMRPVSEPLPANNRYDEPDVVFEVEGRAKLGLGGSPSSHAQFQALPKEEQETSILIECQNCDDHKILKQSHQWRGIPLHYYFSQPSRDPVIQ